MNDTRIPKLVYEWELEVRRCRGRQLILGNMAYIRLREILASQQRMLKIEIDGGLSSVRGKIDYVFG